MRIQYDNQENKEAVYQLWQEAFQDPESFADYYFQWIYPKNRVLVAKEADEICSMIHLNPYLWRWTRDSQMLTLHYIVGVATKESCRRQGLMRQCMQKVLQDLEAQGEPFTYLMPANPAYYTPFHFVTWMKKQVAEVGDLPKTAYAIYPERTEAYMERLKAEVSCEEGDVVVLGAGCYLTYVVDRENRTVLIQQVFRNMEIATYRLVEVEEMWKSAIQELRKRFPDMELRWMKRQPMMLRILNLQRFLELLPYKGEQQVLEIRIQDEICTNNTGAVRIVLSSQGCKLEHLEEALQEVTDEGAKRKMPKSDLPVWDMTRVTEYLLEQSKLAEQVYLMEIV